jgi:hypothetical protein
MVAMRSGIPQREAKRSDLLFISALLYSGLPHKSLAANQMIAFTIKYKFEISVEMVEKKRSGLNKTKPA